MVWPVFCGLLAMRQPAILLSEARRLQLGKGSVAVLRSHSR